MCVVTSFERMSLDDLEIIKIVQANPCLYAKVAKKYKNIDKKHCWEQVGVALTKPKTGEAVQKRWVSLRTMFVRAHRKRMEYIPSGSGAIDSSESDGINFAYYGEMSFLIPHYKPRITRSKVSSIRMPSSTSTSIATNKTMINVPSELVLSLDGLESTSIANTDNNSPISSISSSFSPSHQSVSPPSPTFANKVGKKNPIQLMPFSPSEIKTNTKVIPPSDNFGKRKRNAVDGFLGETVKMMDRMASSVETVVSNRQTKVLSLPEDNALASMSATIVNLMGDIPKEKRRKCLAKILQVIEEFVN